MISSNPGWVQVRADGVPQAKAALIGVTFYNDSQKPVTVLVAALTAHEFMIPACEIEGLPEAQAAVQ